MFGLDWIILDRNDVNRLVEECKSEGLYLVEDINWEIEDKVIYPGFHSPGNFGYTFGIVTFEKRSVESSDNLNIIFPNNCV